MKIPDHLRDVVYVIERVGIATIIVGFLSYLIVVKFSKMEQSIRMVARNQAAMMRKMKIERIPSMGVDRSSER